MNQVSKCKLKVFTFLQFHNFLITNDHRIFNRKELEAANDIYYVTNYSIVVSSVLPGTGYRNIKKIPIFFCHAGLTLDSQ